MAKGRLSMTKLMEILSLHLGEKLSLRATGRSVNCSPKNGERFCYTVSFGCFLLW
jgi:hypothetical protein